MFKLTRAVTVKLSLPSQHILLLRLISILFYYNKLLLLFKITSRIVTETFLLTNDMSLRFS